MNYQGYKISSRFIATQMPLINTVDDLWKAVYDWKVTTLVMLNPLDSSDSVGTTSSTYNINYVIITFNWFKATRLSMVPHSFAFVYGENTEICIRV